MFTSLTAFIKSTAKARMEGIFTIAAVLLVLFTAMMNPAISGGIAAASLVVLVIYGFVKGQKQERGYLND